MQSRVNILGTNYNIIEATEADCPKLKAADANGLCEPYAKELVVAIFDEDPRNVKNLEEFRKKVLRHEIVHAFFMESGLTQYMDDEVLVDWIAIQFSKIHRAMYEADCLEKVI